MGAKRPVSGLFGFGVSVLTTIQPVKSLDAIIYQRSDNPNAAGWFLENGS
jgi:hypothetical protein